MSSYACIAEFFSETDSMAYLSFLCENLEGDTNALQAFLGKSNDRSLSYLPLPFLWPSNPPSPLPQRTLFSLYLMWHMPYALCPRGGCWMGIDWSARLRAPGINCCLGSTRWVWGWVCVRVHLHSQMVHFFDLQQFKLGEAPSLKTVSEVVESAKDSDGSR